jgi:hypothetical protein
MIDMDLPGLTNYVFPQAAQMTIGSAGGIVCSLLVFTRIATSDPAETKISAKWMMSTMAMLCLFAASRAAYGIADIRDALAVAASACWYTWTFELWSHGQPQSMLVRVERWAEARISEHGGMGSTTKH